MDREEYKQKYIERTQKHIQLVNKYAAKMGKSLNQLKNWDFDSP